MAEVNTRPHRATRQPPVMRLAEEHERLHPLPRLPHTVVLRGDPEGQLAVADRGGRRDVLGPARADRRARVGPRPTVTQLIVVHVDGHQGPREVARHQLTTPGRPPHPGRALSAPAGGRARAQAHSARNGEERAFLADRRRRRAVADQARGRGGRAAVRRKMAEAVDLAKLHGTEQVERRAADVRRRWPVRRRRPRQRSSPTSSRPVS